MLLVDALFVNVGGGKVLLDYLVEEIEKNKLNVFYLFDERCIESFKEISSERKVYLKPSLIERRNFYKKNQNKFKKVFCFGNLPPTIKIPAEVYTFFQQRLFINVPDGVAFKEKLDLKLKSFVVGCIKKNTNFWIVQTENVKLGLMQKYKLAESALKVIPFYPPLEKTNKKEREKDSFAYISNAGVHKNHNNLLEAFCNFYDKYRKGKLHLTLKDFSSNLVILIKKLQNNGYPIINHGFIERNRLSDIYNNCEYIICPSLMESFGLSLIEGMENGCKVIGADLPYTYVVCKPSLVFDPLNVKDIEKALEESQNENVKPTDQLVFNQIEELIQILNE